MRFGPARLEHWMREYYFDTDVDIGSSGVQDFAMKDLKEMLPGLDEDMERIVFHDSQTLGGPELRQAIAGRWSDGDPDRVMATHGSSEANFLIMNALLRPDDEVVVLDPCYPQLYLIAQTLGCRLKKWPLRFEDGYVPDVDVLKGLLGPRTRMVVVNFPHNPTGATLSGEQQGELIAAVARSGAYLVWDNAFSELTWGAPPLPDPTARYERAIAMGTLSKGYGLPGLRVGWCIGAPATLQALVHLRDYVTLHLSPLVELIARRAIEHADKLVRRRSAQALANRARVAAWMEEHRELVQWVPPQGGVCAFPRFTGVEDTESLCRDLAREHRVLLVPGNCFEHPRHVRLGFGGASPAVGEGLARLSTLLSAPALKSF